MLLALERAWTGPRQLARFALAKLERIQSEIDGEREAENRGEKGKKQFAFFKQATRLRNIYYRQRVTKRMNC